MYAKTGFGLLNVEVEIELSGDAAGSGDAILVTEDSGCRLVTLCQNAARRFNAPQQDGDHIMISRRVLAVAKPCHCL
ncbi:MAG: hypothetical protein JXA13_16470 [Anaerolineales bacterium]|nr:hypothetical protein [Anaerolineales bacterium]